MISGPDIETIKAWCSKPIEVGDGVLCLLTLYGPNFFDDPFLK